MTYGDVPAPLPALVWAVVFTILLVAAVAVFALSLFASGITTGRATRLLAIPILASAMQGARLHTTHRAEGGPLRGKTGKHLVPLSLTTFEPKRFAYRP